MLPEFDINAELRLRQLTQDDFPALVEYLNDEDIFRNTRSIPHPYTLKDAQDFWEKLRQRSQEAGGAPHHWVIEHREHGFTGTISVFLREGIDSHSDEIGYVMGRPWRGRGYATAAVKALTAMQFETRPNLIRLSAWVYSYNPASKRVLEKAGYVVEGFCRALLLKNGQPVDAWLLARLRND
ncbi:MAG: GNAT family protein [Saprospiraceae bacterium]|nr:GNAT family N-acetyltransferase [Saprospiraceae bacterium]MDW8230731.1 GNAT family protein [Saprospiraceae bacterium]